MSIPEDKAAKPHRYNAVGLKHPRSLSQRRNLSNFFLRLAASNRFIHEMHIKYMRVLKYSRFFARVCATVLKVGKISQAEEAKKIVDTHFWYTWGS